MARRLPPIPLTLLRVPAAARADEWTAACLAPGAAKPPDDPDVTGRTGRMSIVISLTPISLRG
jgi:hypothetical protein